MLKFIKTSLLAAAVAAVGLWAPSTASATTQTIATGSQTGTFGPNVRGFWFTAPVNFWITGVDVPTSASTANFNVAILRLPATPPAWSGTTNTFDILGDFRNQASAVTGLSIAVSAGDVIGVLGNRGDSNSYGSQFVTNILGHSVTLSRFGSQAPLSSTPTANLNVWQEPPGPISRVSLTIDSENPSAPAVPLPASVPLLLSGLGVIAAIRRKRA